MVCHKIYTFLPPTYYFLETEFQSFKATLNYEVAYLQRLLQPHIYFPPCKMLSTIASNILNQLSTVGKHGSSSVAPELLKHFTLFCITELLFFQKTNAALRIERRGRILDPRYTHASESSQRRPVADEH